MANPTIGHIHCPICNEPGEVRRYATGKKKLYWHCGCGQIRPTSEIGQRYIKQNAKFIGDNGDPLPPVNDAKPEQSAAPEPVKDKPRGLLDMIFGDDGAE